MQGRQTMPRRTKRSEQAAVDRRKFLKAATLAGTGALAAGTGAVGAAETTAPAARKSAVQIISRAKEQGAPAPIERPTHTTCGSDNKDEDKRNHGNEFVAAIPGNTF